MKVLGWLGLVWRFVAVAIAFVIFGVVGVVFQLVLWPLKPHRQPPAGESGEVPGPGRSGGDQGLQPPGSAERDQPHQDHAARNHALRRQLLARRIVAFSWRFLVRYMVLSGLITLRMQGLERLGRPGQLILANHPSLLDVLFFIGHVPGLNCVVKADLLSNPSMSAAIRACGFVPNDDSGSILAEADAVLRDGQALLIFPEGTRTGWDGLIRLNRGAVSIGLRSATVITPVVVRMTPPGLKKGQPWYKIPFSRYRCELLVGDDIDPRDWLAEKPLPIASRRLTEYLQAYFTGETTRP
ncbi:MAG: lysophospholipid acyltransferase family protein [Lautropia sp.]|nr:lysophospholipid acyltransferase family protein [Lautropia sp.]